MSASEPQWLVCVVRRAERRASCWDSYTKAFPDEDAFLAWWTSLPADSYTRTRAAVQTFRVRPLELVCPPTPGALIAP